MFNVQCTNVPLTKKHSNHMLSTFAYARFLEVSYYPTCRPPPLTRSPTFLPFFFFFFFFFLRMFFYCFQVFQIYFILFFLNVEGEVSTFKFMTLYIGVRLKLLLLLGTILNKKMFLVMFLHIAFFSLNDNLFLKILCN